MNKIRQVFESVQLNAERLQRLDALPDPRSRYVIAMTPRSGSSYLCDMMTRTRRLGSPREYLVVERMPRLLENLPARNPAEFLRNLYRRHKTENGVAGLKASWFQFAMFLQALDSEDILDGVRYIYLTRRDLAAQAVSLYKATESKVFHTNVTHESAALERLQNLDYDFDKIDKWYKHISAQEEGWERFFYERKITPLCLTYEQIESDVLQSMRRFGQFVGVVPGNISVDEANSAFQRVGDDRNLEWACRYRLERRQRGAT